jgi:hypothetical protein
MNPFKACKESYTTFKAYRRKKTFINQNDKLVKTLFAYGFIYHKVVGDDDGKLSGYIVDITNVTNFVFILDGFFINAEGTALRRPISKKGLKNVFRLIKRLGNQQ